MLRRSVALGLALLAGCSSSSTDPVARDTDRSTTTAPVVTAPPLEPAPTTTTTTTPPGPPVVADEPAGLAAQLVEAERAIRNPATPPEALPRIAHTQQVAYRRLVDRPEWRAEVERRVPPDLLATVRANVEAGAGLRAMITKPREQLPAWRIVAPAPAAELLGYYKEAGAQVGVPWQYLAAIHLVETRMGRIRGTSTAGAQGPMQFLPSTWEFYGEGGDINNNRDAIFAAARLLKRNGAPERMDNAIFNYNRDRRYVRAVLLYGDQMAADERAYLAYHQWQVYYVTTKGDVWLQEGYGT